MRNSKQRGLGGGGPALPTPASGASACSVWDNTHLLLKSPSVGSLLWPP